MVSSSMAQMAASCDMYHLIQLKANAKVGFGYGMFVPADLYLATWVSMFCRSHVVFLFRQAFAFSDLTRLVRTHV